MENKLVQLFILLSLGGYVIWHIIDFIDRIKNGIFNNDDFDDEDEE